jgi:hypothetical protein
MNLGDYDDDGFALVHRIICHSGWEACNGSHQTAAQVKACFEAMNTPGAWPCSWLIPVLGEDGVYTVECGAATTYDQSGDGSYSCTVGHYHVPAEVMAARGEAYASDEYEAKALARNGVLPLQMDGKVYVI